MRRIATKLVMGLAILAAGLMAADNSLGTWKLNMEKSKFTPAAPVKSLTFTREASDGGVKVTATGEQADGTAINGGYTAKYDGKEYPATGAPYDSVAITQLNANSFTVKLKNSGTKYSTTARVEVASDGQTLTQTINGTSATGDPVTYTMVFDKQ